MVVVAAAAAEGQKMGRRLPNHSWQRGPVEAEAEVEVEVEVEEALLLLWC